MASKFGSSSTAAEKDDGEKKQMDPPESESKSKSKRKSGKNNIASSEAPGSEPNLAASSPAKSVPIISPQKPTLPPTPPPAAAESEEEEAPLPVASQHAFGSDEQPCPICLQGPFHLRYKCPTIEAGPEAVEKRMEELREEARRGEGMGLQWPNLAQELGHMLRQMKARAGLSRSAATPDHIKSSARKLIIPSGSTVSEVTVEHQGEGSSNEGSDDDEDEDEEEGEDDEDVVPAPRQEKSSSPYKLPPSFSGIADLGDLDLEALIRGPTSQSKSVLDNVPSRSDSEDEDLDDAEEPEEEEDEENDKQYRRRAKRLEKSAASSDEDEDVELPADGDEDVKHAHVGKPVDPREISPELGHPDIAHEDAPHQAGSLPLPL